METLAETSFKNRFPNEETVRRHIHYSLGKDFIEKVRTEHAKFFADYKWITNRRLASILVPTVFISTICLFIGGIIQEETNELNVFLVIGIIGFIVVFTIVGALGHFTDFFEDTNKYHATVSVMVFEETLKLFGIEGTCQNLKKGFDSLNAATRAEILQMVESSGYRAGREKVYLDEMCTITIAGRTVRWGEIAIGLSDGNRNEKGLFRGHYVNYPLSKRLSGTTQVSTIGKLDNLKSTKLEWNDFNKLLNVAASDPIEARYILSPDFMEDLYHWWNGRHNMISVLFSEDQVHILYRTAIRIDESIEDITHEELYRLMEETALPFMHLLHLLEDIQEWDQPRGYVG